MPKQDAREFRRAACERLVAGERVSSLSEELGVSEGTLDPWKRQALIDAPWSEGIKSFETDELAQAHRTIAELEAELEAVEAAVACSTRRSPSAPKAVPDWPRPEQSGLQRARRVPDRRRLSLVFRPVQVPRPPPTARSAGSCSAASSPISTRGHGAPVACCASERPPCVNRTWWSTKTADPVHHVCRGHKGPCPDRRNTRRTG